MSNAAILPRTGHSFAVVVHRILRSLGLGRRARGQRATYIQLSRLSDRQLDDIGLTMQKDDKIADFEAKRQQTQPWA